MDSNVQKIFDTVDDAVQAFQKQMPGIQERMLEEVQQLTHRLKVKNGRIANTIDNFKVLGELKTRLQKIVLNKQYLEAVKQFTEAFAAVDTAYRAYFSTFATSPTTTTLDFLKEVRVQSIDSTLTQLTEAGLKVNVLAGIEDILKQNITTGGRLTDFNRQMADHLVKNEDGALLRYTRTWVTDSLNTYSRTYMATVSTDLGLEWAMYVGSLLTTSRPWCQHMTQKKWVHVSELKTILEHHVNGHAICSKDIPCNKKTGLPAGMKEGTNVNNIMYWAGGWNCGHKFIFVDDLAVPEMVKQAVYATPEYKAWKAGR